jgi:hypothetical protein
MKTKEWIVEKIHVDEIPILTKRAFDEVQKVLMKNCRTEGEIFTVLAGYLTSFLEGQQSIEMIDTVIDVLQEMRKNLNQESEK